MLHSKLATVLPPESVPLKVKLALPLLDGFGGVVLIVVLGGVASTFHVNEAGVGSTLVALSIARTWKVWLP